MCCEFRGGKCHFYVSVVAGTLLHPTTVATDLVHDPALTAHVSVKIQYSISTKMYSWVICIHITMS